MGDDSVKYQIPEEIKKQIPEYFYESLWGELVSVFGSSVIEITGYTPDEKEESFEPIYGLAYCTSTCGWNAAVWATCRKLDLMPIYEYYDGLGWVESDLFDGEIEEELYKHIPGRKSPNPYFLYLLHNRPVKIEVEEDG